MLNYSFLWCWWLFGCVLLDWSWKCNIGANISQMPRVRLQPNVLFVLEVAVWTFQAPVFCFLLTTQAFALLGYINFWSTRRMPATIETSTRRQMFAVKDNTQKPLIQILISFSRKFGFRVQNIWRDYPNNGLDDHISLICSLKKIKKRISDLSTVLCVCICSLRKQSWNEVLSWRVIVILLNLQLKSLIRKSNFETLIGMHIRIATRDDRMAKISTRDRNANKWPARI